MNEIVRNSVKTLIKETFEGPEAKGSWFTEAEPNSGIFGVLGGTSSDLASRSVYGTTLAAHTDHIRYYLWGTNETLKKGKQPEMDWGKSWTIHSVDEQQWNHIQAGLRNEYVTLLQLMDDAEWNERKANEMVASLAHSAYHLGAIRQMLKVVNG
ncbi:hypothetical protein MKZ19_21970 [Shouchella clausii]|uniref:DinB family protein n=1 Tax=Shouchella rhizosphaerae TaxID=866786 RepID=A0ABZ2D2Q5_9BACI|nr:hypothetical protein [Shouchella rhizosphaerae]MCM3381023.1 hypothetical protein [Shouchella rhizosphaerae]